jgi:copper chaperone NosL
MKTSSRNIILLCTFMMIGAFFFPFWKIMLEAPQYPEGLEMKIWLYKITGDVDKINGLNHYIGMKLIHEDEFPEFKIMPWALGLLIAFGMIGAIMRKRTLVWAWIAALAVAGGVAFYDFYQWLYDYGHNLDPHAAIKVPGMSYQPPMLGYKQLLNFLAGSFPDFGGYLVILAALGIVGVAVYEQFFRKNKKSGINSLTF